MIHFSICSYRWHFLVHQIDDSFLMWQICCVCKSTRKNTTQMDCVWPSCVSTLRALARSPAVTFLPINLRVQIPPLSSFSRTAFFTQNVFIAGISLHLHYLSAHPPLLFNDSLMAGTASHSSLSTRSQLRTWYTVSAYNMVITWERNGARPDERLQPETSNSLCPYF